jgi:hypothetical protein
VVAVVGDKESGGDGGRSGSIGGVKSFEKLGGLSGGQWAQEKECKGTHLGTGCCTHVHDFVVGLYVEEEGWYHAD